MMKTFSRIQIRYVLLVIILVFLGVTLIVFKEVNQSYIGMPAKLVVPNQNDRLEIDQAILNMHPLLTPGVQATIIINAFTKTAAKEVVTYSSSKYAAQKVMTVKFKDVWIIIEHTTSKTLPLPNNAIARKYSLPFGWYSVN